MPFANKKPDASINIHNYEYAPFIAECAFTESYAAGLADTVAWLTQTSGAVRVVLLVKLTEYKADLVPPLLSVDEAAEDDNSPSEAYEDDPAYEHLRESTVSSEWMGPLEEFAELWRCNSAGEAVRDGDRAILVPRPSTGLATFRITKADIEGCYAKPGDELLSCDLDLEQYYNILIDAVEKQAFQRRVRCLKAMQAREANSGEEKEA